MIRPRHPMTGPLRVIAVLAAASSLTGCLNMSGISGAHDSFSCKAPEGVSCNSVSGTYSNAVQDNLPGLQKTAPTQPAEAAPATKTARLAGMVPGAPLRSAPRELRIWFAPNEDADHDFWDERYCYMVVDSGRWMVEHSRARLAEHYRPALPTLKSIPVVAAPPAAEPAPAKTDTPEQDKPETPEQPAPGAANNVQ